MGIQNQQDSGLRRDADDIDLMFGRFGELTRHLLYDTIKVLIKKANKTKLAGIQSSQRIVSFIKGIPRFNILDYTQSSELLNHRKTRAKGVPGISRKFA
jgi:hypothetical protein